MRMKEIEIKIRDVEKDKIIEAVEALGAYKNFTGRVIDYRFDTEDRKLSKQGKALRIRQKGRYIYLNLKGRKKSNDDNIVNREELGVKLSNFKTMHRILLELGYIKIFELNKYRTEYKLDDIKFDIDEYLGMPPILEIEGSSYEKVEKYMKKLNINPDTIGRVYIRELIAAKKRYEEKRNSNNSNNNSNNNSSPLAPPAPPQSKEGSKKSGKFY